VELARIGFNDITQTYAIDEEQRQQRMEALLKSVLFTYMQPNGAMRSAQAPHMVDFAGVVTYSRSTVPAPTVSPLKDSYREQLEALGTSLEKIAPGGVTQKRFDSLSEFADIIHTLGQDEPYTLRYA
jgi:CRISPR-associated protein Cst2